MSQIEKFISPFIAQQFPAFYRDEGPNFIAFVKAYYEWMEESGNIIHESRSLLEYLDIDSTSDLFLTYFKNTLIKSLPEDLVADKKLLMKHIFDLYRSKGTQRSYELLFRMIYGEEIELYIPNQYIFKPSDNTWKIPNYIETTSHPNLYNIIGTKIKTNSGATAIVESVDKKIVNNRTINILTLTSVYGNFIKGEQIYQVNGTDVTSSDGPIITGSLIAIAVTSGGAGFYVGQVLNIGGSGVEGTARVTSVKNDTIGSVGFSIINGGTGFSTNAVVTVKQTLNLFIINKVGAFSNNQTIVDSSTSANGIITFSNSTNIQLIDRSTSLNFNVGNEVTTPTGSAVIERILGGTGSYATFKVGGITNKEVLNLNTDTTGTYFNTQLDQTSNSFLLALNTVSGSFSINNTVTSTANVIQLEGNILSSNNVANGEFMSNNSLGISGLYVYKSDFNHLWVTASTDAALENANLISGIILVSNASSSEIQLVTKPEKQTITGNAVIQTVSGNNITLSSVNGYFIPSKTLTSNNGATGNITSINRLTDWIFPKNFSDISNLDTTIVTALNYSLFEFGTILYLSQINPGTGYTTKVYIDVIEPVMAALNIYDESGNLKGHNAVFDSSIVRGSGIVSSVKVINSGYGYLNNESVNLVNPLNSTSVGGSTIIGLQGTGEGYWTNRKSFTSDIMKIQDSSFYQDYSYQIISEKMLNVYEDLVRNLIHPSGIALYGKYRLNDQQIDNESSLVESSIT